MGMIYKICPRETWESAANVGEFLGAAIDLADGFIHFSAGHQVRETAHKHFAGQQDLVLVAVDPQSLGSALRWEASRGGDNFPHLYGPLTMDAVRSVISLPVDAAGEHVFPEDLDEKSD